MREAAGWIEDSVIKALPDDLQVKASAIPKPQTDRFDTSNTEYSKVGDFVNDLLPKTQSGQESKLQKDLKNHASDFAKLKYGDEKAIFNAKRTG